jgi:hypothetical protein
MAAASMRERMIWTLFFIVDAKLVSAAKRTPVGGK